MSNTASGSPATAVAPVRIPTVRFTKLDDHGNPLAADAAEWSAVRVATGDLHFDVLAGNLTKSSTNFAKAEAACAKVDALGTTDWRLPTLFELEALRDITRFRPAVDPQYFPDFKSDWYWSSSPYAAYPDCAWIVSFGGGGTDWGRRGSNGAFVRAVRSVPASQ